MRYAVVFALTILLGFAHAAPAAAQQTAFSAVEQFLSRITSDDDLPRDRRPMLILRDRNVAEQDDERRRGPTSGRDAKRPGRSETGARTGRAERADPTERTDRAQRTQRRDTRSGPGDLGRRGGNGDYGRETAGKRGEGPMFCRNGQGHPVHGRQWCFDKGFGYDRDRSIFDRRRDERRYPTRDRRTSPPGSDRTILEDILGRRLND